MSSKRSKRESFRAFLNDPGPTLKNMFRSRSPTPSSSSANHPDARSPTPTPHKPAPAITPGRASDLVQPAAIDSTADRPILTRQPVQPPTLPGQLTSKSLSSYVPQPSHLMMQDQGTTHLSRPPRVSPPSPPAIDLPKSAPLDTGIESKEAPELEETPDIAVLAPKPSQQLPTLAKDTASAVLKATSEALKNGMGAVPAFKDVANVLSGCISAVPTAAKNRREFDGIAASIAVLQTELEEHLGKASPTQMSRAIVNAIDELDPLAKHINDKQARTKAKAYVDAEQDIDDLIECYRSVENILRRLQSRAVLSTWRIVDRSFDIANEILADARLEKLRPARMAAYNSSAASQLRRRTCTPNTRRLVLQGLQNWASDPQGAKVYWMNGMAGTGKTTVAYSFCGWLQASDQLAASFFCSRSLPECRDVSRIAPTIANQLARFCRPIKDVLRRVLEDDDAATRIVPTQFEQLLVQPLQEVKRSLPVGLPVVVIDALDECSGREDARMFLDTLLSFARDLPIKFFVTSRPEDAWLNQLSSGSNARHSLFHLHDIEKSLVQADIWTYLDSELETIHVGESNISRLAEKSGALFIFAATVVRYIAIGDPYVDQQERLDTVLGDGPNPSDKLHEPLDFLYTTVLSSALDNENLEPRDKTSIELLLHTVVFAREPLSVESLTRLLRLKGFNQAMRAIKPLQSVLHVDERSGLVSTLHASFSDYMRSPSRSNRFYCDEAKHSNLLTGLCFETMEEKLRFNMCDLESSYVLDDQVPDMQIRIDRSIPSHLFYACRYWSDYLVLADNSSDLLPHVQELLYHRMLSWVEVMNLKRSTGAGVVILAATYRWMKAKKMSDEDCVVCQDAQKFITVVGANPVSKSTPHIYISVLALWDKSDPMWLHYGSRMCSPVQAKGTAIDNRESAALSVWQAKTEVFSISVSPDGNKVASAHLDGTVCVWDTHTGDVLVGPLKGHTDYVNSLAFSSDGTRIISGSDDHTLRIWDASTGQRIVDPLRGHTNYVRSVTYSPDGRYLASGADDRTIRIWDTTTGQPVGKPYIGHTWAIWSIAYSPDGRRLVSGAGDCTIRIWDAQTGNQLIDSLIGHTGKVRSVTFSRDGSRIASGSEDHTVRIWDSQSGQLVTGPFEGHADSVHSVAYSPDGNHIVSGSKDHTIRIWDAHTGQTVAGPLRGHTNWVYAAVFMPDGDRIVSGSSDHTIRIWDARTRHTRSSLSEGHTDAVRSVAFSPDSSQILSGSDDCTVYIWDAQTGSRKVGPLKGHTSDVNSVAFSPSGDRVASASDDRTIRVWDARTGSMHGGPFEGHTAEIFSIAFSPDGSRIASGSRDFTIRVWDSQTGKMVAGPFRGHTSSVFSVAYSPDGDRIVSGSGDRTVRNWDARTGMALAPSLEGHTDVVYSVAYSPDGKHIVSGSYDFTILIWDVQSGATLLGTLIGHTDTVRSVAYSLDGRCVISGSDDHTIRIWDAETRQPSAGPFRAHSNWVISVAISPDGRLIASGSPDHAIRGWDLQKCLSTGPANRDYWTMNGDGWIVGHDSSLLFWVPPDLRPCLKWPQNVAVINQLGSFELDFTNASIGPRWTECYKSE